MNRSTLCLMVIAFLLNTLVGCQDKQKPAPSDLPNIVLIISDDQSWTDFSMTGHPHIQTPNLDRLARTGLTFTYGYTAAPLCRPALASIATGLYPYQHKVFGNDPIFESQENKYSGAWLTDRKVINDSIVQMFQAIPTLAEVLEQAGYVSLQTGKWWEGSFEQGGFTEGMTHGDPLRNGRHGDDGLTIGRNGLQPIFSFIDDARNQNKPFFIWYAPFLPHAPHTPPDSLSEKYRELAPSEAVANYWAMCEWFDHGCGQLEAYVNAHELRENTVFVFVTDNGWIQDPDRPNRYAPKSKRTPYEMGIRTPIFFNWPKTITPAWDSITPVSSIDIMPTLLALCNLPVSSDLPGIDVLDDEKLAARSTIFAEAYAHDFSGFDSSLFYSVAIQWPWKIILPDAGQKPDEIIELFDINEDPHEHTNLASQYPDIVKELTQEIEQWRIVD